MSSVVFCSVLQGFHYNCPVQGLGQLNQSVLSAPRQPQHFSQGWVLLAGGDASARVVMVVPVPGQ